MYIKYEYIGDLNLLRLPRNDPWSLHFQMFDDNGCGDYSVYLTVNSGKPLTILDADYFCSGNPDLPCHAVGYLFEELIDVISKQLINDPNTTLIDIPSLVRQLVDTKYRDLWIQKGYIPADWQMYD